MPAYRGSLRPCIARTHHAPPTKRHPAMSLEVPDRVVRVELEGEARWGRLVGGSIVLDDGSELDEAEALYLAPGRADEDPRRPPHVPLARRGVRGADAARAVVLRQAADDAQRPPAPDPDGEGRAFPQLRGRARGRRRPAHERCPSRRSARSRRRLHVRERRRDARLPARRSRLDAAREGPGRLPPTRAGARSRLGVRPGRLHAPHLPERATSSRRRPPATSCSPSRTSSPTCAARSRSSPATSSSPARPRTRGR